VRSFSAGTSMGPGFTLVLRSTSSPPLDLPKQQIESIELTAD
jgi:hypothetical protein